MNYEGSKVLASSLKEFKTLLVLSLNLRFLIKIKIIKF